MSKKPSGTRTLLTGASLLAATAALVGVAPVARAQQAAVAPAAASADEEIVVTGTRIHGVTNANSASPISVQTADDIALTKAISVEDALLRMVGPDVTGGSNINSNNGAVGISSIGLRNLGPSRTLVLVDGQRLLPIFAGAASVPDLNAVPASIVDRIEVLRDGASSVYGADAVGGVINIITKQNFEGFRLDGSAGQTSEGDAPSYSAQALLGMNMDRGNVTIALSMDRQAELPGQNRDWAGNVHRGQPNQGGSAYRSQVDVLQDENNSNTIWVGGNVFDRTNPVVGTLGVPCLDYLTGPGIAKLNANCSVGWNDLAGFVNRDQLSMNGHYDINDNVRFITSASFTHRLSGQQLRPEPLLGDTIASRVTVPGVAGTTTIYNGFMVPVSWPGMSDPNNDSIACADPNGCVLAFLTPIQFGPRTYRQTSDTYRMRFGFEGDVGDYHWEAGYVRQQNDTVQRILNSGNWNHLAQITGQLNCVNVPGGCEAAPAGWLSGTGAATGAITSVPVVKPNFTDGPLIFSPEQVAYLTFTAQDTNKSAQDFFYGDVSGPLIDLPGGPLQMAAGFEHREEHIEDNPDALVVEGYAAGTTNPTKGAITVTSVYGELNIPIIEGLTISPSYRVDTYDLFGTANTYKIGADWAITPDLRFRAAYNTGFRAPSLAELFGGNGISFVGASGDPCDERTLNGAGGTTDNSNSGQGLRAAGSTCAVAINGGAAYTTFHPSNNAISNNQLPLLVGGAADLQPETSTGWNAGFVMTPRFLPGFLLTYDHYDVKIENSILTGGIAQSVGPNLVLLGCYGPAQDAASCNLVHRSSTGNIVQIDSPNTNVGSARVVGDDVEVAWDSRAAHVDLPLDSRLNISVQGEHESENSQVNPDGSITEFSGFYNVSSESVQPKWRGTVNVNWDVSSWTLHWDSRFVESMKQQGGGPTLPDYWIHGLAVAYDFGNWGPTANTRLTFGVNNIFDKDPPFSSVTSLSKSNSLAGPYDFYGRTFFTRLSAEF